jgi:hypothetical protein
MTFGNFPKQSGGARGVGNPVCPQRKRSNRNLPLQMLWANVGLSMPLSAGESLLPLLTTKTLLISLSRVRGALLQAACPQRSEDSRCAKRPQKTTVRAYTPRVIRG